MESRKVIHAEERFKQPEEAVRQQPDERMLAWCFPTPNGMVCRYVAGGAWDETYIETPPQPA